MRVVVVAAACAALTACHDAGSSSAKPLHAPANFDPSLEGTIACSRLIVEGTVLQVTDSDRAGFMNTRMKVHRWVKPMTGPKVASIETADIAGEGVYERWRPGTRLFLLVDVDPTALPSWQLTRQLQRELIRTAMKPITVTCPYGP